MSSAAPGKEAERKAPVARNRADAKIQGEAVDIKCMFCWFILEVYPDLTNMRPKDGAAFHEHLVKAHGLKQEIAV